MQDLLRNKARLEHDIKIKSNSLFIDRFHQIPQRYCWHINGLHICRKYCQFYHDPPPTGRNVWAWGSPSQWCPWPPSFEVKLVKFPLNLLRVCFLSPENVSFVSLGMGCLDCHFNSCCPLRMFVNTKLFRKKFWNVFFVENFWRARCVKDDLLIGSLIIFSTNLKRKFLHSRQSTSCKFWNCIFLVEKR